MKRDTITLSEAAKLLPFSVATIRRHAAELGGWKYPGCKRWCFSRRTLAAWQSRTEAEDDTTSN